jgi:hypothetical protein
MRVIEYRCPASRGQGRTCRRHLATVTVDDLGEVSYEQGPHGALAGHDPERPNPVREFLDEFDYVGNYVGPMDSGPSLNGLLDVHCDRHGYVATIGAHPWRPGDKPPTAPVTSRVW